MKENLRFDSEFKNNDCISNSLSLKSMDALIDWMSWIRSTLKRQFLEINTLADEVTLKSSTKQKILRYLCFPSKN